MSTLSVRPSRVRKSTPAPDSFHWVKRLSDRWGVLDLCGTLYHVREEQFTYDNGMAGRLWDLLKQDGTHYRLTVDADDTLQCDCPHSCFRPDALPCRHRRLLPLALAEVERAAALAAWLAEPTDHPF